MELRQIEIFLEVCRLNHFTHAAQSLGVAQPAVSQAIGRLEQELGVLLFTRSGKAIQLTEAGKAFFARAQHIQRELQLAHYDMLSAKGIISGQLVIGATPTIAAHMLPKALAMFLKRYPHIDIRLRESGAGTLTTLLARGSIDCCIMVQPENSDALEVVPLFTEPLMLAASAESHIANLGATGPIPLKVARDIPFILYRSSYHLRSATLFGCRAAGFEPRIALEGGEMETVLRMVAADLGVSLTPRLAFEGASRLGVAAVAFCEPELSRTMAFCRKKGHPETAAMRAFFEVTQELAVDF